MIQDILYFINNSSWVSLIVFFVLSLYFIGTVWIFIYKYIELMQSIGLERSSLDTLLKNDSRHLLSNLGSFIDRKDVSKEMLEVYQIALVRDATSGLSLQSIIASTAPFIGLFGTVVGILESFASFATVDKVSFSVIAPVISEALIATAAGFFVAIFAYTFHQILSRKIYTLDTYLKSQINIILLRK